MEIHERLGGMRCVWMGVGGGANDGLTCVAFGLEAGNWPTECVRWKRRSHRPTAGISPTSVPPPKKSPRPPDITSA